MSITRTTIALASGCAGLAVTAQIGGKALRDALFLSAFPVSDLPLMVMAAALLTMVAALGVTRLFTGLGPRRVTSALFVGSAGLLALEGYLSGAYPEPVAVAFYLHLGVFGTLLISGVWSTVSEAFDPASARKSIGRIAGGATAGGLVGGLLAERVAVWFGPVTMFAVLVGVQLCCAALVLGLKPITRAEPDGDTSIRKSLRAVGKDRYLLQLTGLVIAATALENLLDFLLKAEAAAALDQAELMRFFGVFYTVLGLATFLVQVGVSSRVLTRFGPARAASGLPVAAGAGALALLLGPGLLVAAVSRGAYGAMRNSLFRSGYELFFAPLPQERKRTVKTLIDVGADRTGDLVASLFVTAVIFMVPGDPGWLLALTAGILAVWLGFMTWELQRGYRRTLETQLIDRGGELAMTQTILHSNLFSSSLAGFGQVPIGPEDESEVEEAKPAEALARLLQGEFESRTAIDALADDEVAATAFDALARNPEQHVAELSAALNDRSVPFDARRRIPPLLAQVSSAAARDALFSGLDDRRFEVRFRCGALLFAARRSDDLQIDGAAVHEVLESELRVSRRVWEARRVLERDGADDRDALDARLGERVDRSLQHVFHLLALLHPVKPLRVAFRGLHTEDAMLRGTALEYLATILPAELYRRLAVIIGEDARSNAAEPARALESLLASQASVELRIEALGVDRGPED